MARGNLALGFNGILRALRLAKPHSVVAVGHDGTETKVNLSGARGRYERGARTLVSLECKAFKCIDRDDAVTEVIIVDHPEETAEESTPDGKKSAPSTSQELAKIAAIVFEAQDKATARQSDMVTRVTNAAVQIMEAGAEGMRHASERASTLERGIEKLLNRRIRELDETARLLDRGMQDLAETAAEERDTSPGAAADELLGELIQMARPSRAAAQAKKPKPEPEKPTG